MFYSHKSWTKIVDGIPGNTFARTIRIDPERPGLLYAGTENGLFVSFDDGDNWQSLQQNLPLVPITDLYVQQNDLVVSTQGRSLWILDDLTPLHQIFDGLEESAHLLLKPDNPVRNISNGYPDSGPGENPPVGLQAHPRWQRWRPMVAAMSGASRGASRARRGEGSTRLVLFPEVGMAPSCG